MDRERYLRRISAGSRPALSASSLARLTRAHLETIPFENLDLAVFRRPPSLLPEALYEKMVLSHRGGYCFELNKLFNILLRELGFSCYPVVARVVYRRSDPRPLAHRATVVCLHDTRWLCDVGLFGPGPKGILSLTHPGIQCVAGEEFSVRQDGGLFTVCRHDSQEGEPVLVFRDEPWEEVDFDVLHGYYSHHPDSVFTQKRILFRCVPGGQISLVGNCFTTVRNGETQVRHLSKEEEFEAVYREQFALRNFETASGSPREGTIPEPRKKQAGSGANEDTSGT